MHLSHRKAALKSFSTKKYFDFDCYSFSSYFLQNCIIISKFQQFYLFLSKIYSSKLHHNLIGYFRKDLPFFVQQKTLFEVEDLKCGRTCALLKSFSDLGSIQARNSEMQKNQKIYKPKRINIYKNRFSNNFWNFVSFGRTTKKKFYLLIIQFCRIYHFAFS